jgi:signal transduction histidine kinase/CheY-like chemotaxis protein
VLQQDKTAYISDLRAQRDLSAPFADGECAHSILATPVRVAGAHYGVLLARSAQVGHWTQEQFRMIEWLAAQCGLIAEALRWQRVLAERALEIEAANHAKDQFLAMLSHELRTPLTPVLAAAGSLEHDERIPIDVREDLQMIRRNVTIQSRLIDDLLDLTRLGRGKFELVSESLDIAALVKETVAIVSADVDAKNQTLALDLRAAEGCTVFGDGSRLKQVFWNLLKNSIKFSPFGGRIGVTAQLVAGPAARIAVEVSDGGIGIHPDNLERIFRPFEQIVDAGKQRGNDGGLGLGLTIAKALVELHQGTIKVASDGIGLGSKFTVELPLAAAPVEVPAPATKPGATGPSLRILLVEDHDDTSRVLARLLRNAGHAVEQADTAASAFETFRNSTFDLIISDLGLPGENGTSLMRRLRALQPSLPGICLSGYGMEEDLRACREAGFAEHLTKPVDVQRLHAAITRVTTQNGN